jgi:hypothetical protein
MTPRELARLILELTPAETQELLVTLRMEGGEPFAGVREPRNPLPENDEGQALPDDYWETAQ